MEAPYLTVPNVPSDPLSARNHSQTPRRITLRPASELCQPIRTTGKEEVLQAQPLTANTCSWLLEGSVPEALHKLFSLFYCTQSFGGLRLSM